MYKNLRKALKENKINHKDLQNALGIKSLGTISLKITGKSIITTDEAKKIKALLNSRSKKTYTLDELFDE